MRYIGPVSVCVDRTGRIDANGGDVTQKSVARTYQGMNPLDEAGAWGRAAAGDGDAFGRLFDAHHGRVYRHGLRLTGDVHDAEDVLAAAFLELWRRRKDCEDRQRSLKVLGCGW